MTADMTRRTALAAGAAMTPGLALAKTRQVAFIYDMTDAVTSPPALLAAEALEVALRQAGFVRTRIATLAKGGTRIIVTSHPGPAEGFTIQRRDDTVTVSGSDARGLSYGLRELARRLATDPGTALTPEDTDTQPINRVRSVMRQFTCETYDTPWFHDRGMWPAYLAMLAENRFNRLHLAFGLGYDSLAHVRDPYFLFTYPYLLDVPGYDVGVTGLSVEERARNLDTLKFMARETVRHGLAFQLGLWMHGYQWPAADGVATITGLTPATHETYCRDALALLLKEVPEISAVALRIHGESGIKEGSYGFWKTVFSGVATAGRTVEIDLHAKGVDDEMIANALATGQPVNVSPKYWGEHLGMPYHQAAIRENEMPKDGQVGQGLMTLSEGARSFTRYGYADLLREDRRYTVRHRVFPGTQHILASGGGSAYAVHGKMFGFCGSTGTDLMEPLTYRGRRGTATATARDGYAARKMATHDDWRKYAAWYHSFGLGLYSGEMLDDDPALAAASRILPLVTTAYAPSAACDAYWPEVYWNQPLAAEPSPNPYADNLGDKAFDNATPFDPQLFSSMRDHAAELLGRASGRISPVIVATWLEKLAAEAGANSDLTKTVENERQRVDIAIQAGLGRFFAAKFRAGVLFALFKATQDGRALQACLTQYEKARTAWAGVVDTSAGVYGDLSSSDTVTEHGAWTDKLRLIAADIAALKLLPATAGSDPNHAAAIASAQADARSVDLPLTHVAAGSFTPGETLALRFGAGDTTEATLWYRHVNQAERWQSLAMTKDGGDWTGVIPAAYTQSPYPLQYYVEAWLDGGAAGLYPGLTREPQSLPYFILRAAR